MSVTLNSRTPARRFALAFVPVVVLVSCGRNEQVASDATAPAIVSTSTSPSAPTTLTGAQPTTLTTPGTTSPIAPSNAPTTALTPSSAPAAGNGVAVVYASGGDEFPWLPVGWWDGATWGSVGWPDDFDGTLPTSSFDEVSVASVDLEGGALGEVLVAPALYSCNDSPLPSFTFPLELPGPEFGYGYQAIGVTAGWEMHPRPVRAVGLDAPEYQAAGEALVPTDQPVDPSAGNVAQVLRADLDGDGIEEVLFTFENWTDTAGMGTPGNFSLVAARYPDAAGGVVDEVLVAHVVPPEPDFPQPDRSRVAAIADLNGDGRMEVAVATVFWEGASIAVYEFRDGSLQHVMSAACGV